MKLKVSSRLKTISPYQFLLNSRTAAHWNKIGAHRRAGVLFPLFSLHSESSTGVGEFPDLVRLADWCCLTGLSMIQLLPLNDIGTDFRPYDASSSFALEPMYLSLEKLEGIPADSFHAPIRELKKTFPMKGQQLFDTRIKPAKLALLREIFSQSKPAENFSEFKKQEEKWLEPYVQFKTLKAKFNYQAWWTWEKSFRERGPEALAQWCKDAAADMEFERWLQWQAAIQLEESHRQVNRKGVFLMGDLPFLVSRDSADVWANPHFFKLDHSSGAPPDMYFSGGQVWGMPPHDWDNQEKAGFDYLKQKVAYASRFYDLFRIDHFVGLFRVWTFKHSPDGQVQKDTGAFDPPDEKDWESHGRKILDAILESSMLLPCAEDLGVVPNCSSPVLRDYGIPGMEIQRWTRHWEGDGSWKKSEEYRPNSLAAISTHDMTPLELWWKSEASAGPERTLFNQYLNGNFSEPTFDFIKSALNACLSTESIFSIQLFQDWFSLEAPGVMRESDRINLPGWVDDRFWRLLSEYSLEEMNHLRSKEVIHSLITENNRVIEVNKIVS